MWIYIGIALVATAWYFVPQELYQILQSRTGLQWIRQVIANKLASHLIEMHHKYYVIHYPCGVTWYKIIVPRRRGPCKIDTITDSGDEDVKKDVLSYMGLSHSFHGLPITPKMLGYESLCFTFLNGDVKKYGENENIAI